MACQSQPIARQSGGQLMKQALPTLWARVAYDATCEVGRQHNNGYLHARSPRAHPAPGHYIGHKSASQLINQALALPAHKPLKSQIFTCERLQAMLHNSTLALYGRAAQMTRSETAWAPSTQLESTAPVKCLQVMLSSSTLSHQSQLLQRPVTHKTQLHADTDTEPLRTMLHCSTLLIPAGQLR